MRRSNPSRRSIDAIARAVVTGRRHGGRRIDSLADLVASQMRNRLEAVGAPGARRMDKAARARSLADAALVHVLLERTTKHLAAWGRRADAGAHTD